MGERRWRERKKQASSWISMAPISNSSMVELLELARTRLLGLPELRARVTAFRPNCTPPLQNVDAVVATLTVDRRHAAGVPAPRAVNVPQARQAADEARVGISAALGTRSDSLV